MLFVKLRFHGALVCVNFLIEVPTKGLEKRFSHDIMITGLIK
jgi:hypothetical protein